MKKRYIHPELDILQFGEEDIITTSGDTEDFQQSGDDGWVDSEDGWN